MRPHDADPDPLPDPATRRDGRRPLLSDVPEKSEATSYSPGARRHALKRRRPWSSHQPQGHLFAPVPVPTKAGLAHEDSQYKGSLMPQAITVLDRQGVPRHVTIGYTAEH